MVFNVISNRMSVISWRSALLVEETGIPGESHSPWTGFELTTLLVICTDCSSRYKSKYNAIRTTMVLFLFGLIISRIYFKLECQGDLCVLICYWMNVMLLFSMTLVMMSFNIYVEFNDAPSHLQLFTRNPQWLMNCLIYLC